MLIYAQLSQPELIKSRLVTSQYRGLMTSSFSLPDMLHIPRDHRARDRPINRPPYERVVYRHHHSNDVTSSPSVSIGVFLLPF